MKKFLYIFFILLYSSDSYCGLQNRLSSDARYILKLEKLDELLHSNDKKKYLEKLNCLASCLLYQDEFMKILDDCIIKYTAFENLQNEMRSDSDAISNEDGSWDFNRPIASSEALSLALRYSNIFKGLIIDNENFDRDAIKEKCIKVMQSWIHIPGIHDLVQKWKASDDLDVRFFGKIIYYQLEKDKKLKIKNKALNVFINGIADITDINTSKKFFVLDFISTEKGLSVEILKFLGNINSYIDYLNQFRDAVFNNNNNKDEFDNRLIEMSRPLLEI